MKISGSATTEQNLALGPGAIAATFESGPSVTVTVQALGQQLLLNRDHGERGLLLEPVLSYS
jgi:hypothetical protein